jgi:hypothetical protein
MDALLRGKRQFHPSLTRPLPRSAVQNVCRRENVRVKKGPLPDAVLLAVWGSPVIVPKRDVPVRRYN